jgi:hypothetical protein
MNPVYKYLLAIGVFAAWSFGMYHWGSTQQDTKDQLVNAKATVTQTNSARGQEQAITTAGFQIDAAYQRGLLEGRKNAQTLTDSLLNGSVGMYVPDPTAAAVPRDNGPSASQPSAKARCELPRQTAADLARLANDANENTRQLNSLIDYVHALEQILDKRAAPQSTHLLGK